MMDQGHIVLPQDKGRIGNWRREIENRNYFLPSPIPYNLWLMQENVEHRLIYIRRDKNIEILKQKGYQCEDNELFWNHKHLSQIQRKKTDLLRFEWNWCKYDSEYIKRVIQENIVVSTIPYK